MMAFSKTYSYVALLSSLLIGTSALCASAPSSKPAPQTKAKKAPVNTSAPAKTGAVPSAAAPSASVAGTPDISDNQEAAPSDFGSSQASPSAPEIHSFSQNVLTPIVTLETIGERSASLLGLSPSARKSDSLENALEATYRFSPDIKAQIAATNSADEQERQAMAGYYPQVSGTLSTDTSKTYSKGDRVNSGPNSVTTQDGQNQSAKLQLSQNLFNGGGTTFQVKAAQSSVQAARSQLGVTIQQTFSSTIQIYMNLLTQMATVEILTNNESVALQALESTRQRVAVGEENTTSLAQAQANYSDIKIKNQTAQSTLASTVASYIQIVGRGPGILKKPCSIQGLWKQLPKTPEAAMMKARLQNPEIVAARYQEQVNREKAKEYGAAKLPKVDLLASSSVGKQRTSQSTASALSAASTDTTTNHQATLNVTIPFYDGGVALSQKRQAIEAASQARMKLDSLTRATNQKIKSSYDTLRFLMQSLEFAKEKVKAYQVSLSGTIQQMAVGNKIILDVLNAQQQLLQAQQELINLEQSIYLTLYTLQSLIGDLNPKGMRLSVKEYNPEVHYSMTKRRVL